MPGKHHLRGFKIAKKKIGSPVHRKNAIMPLVDARKTSLTGVQNRKKKSARRFAARGRCSASSLGQTPPPLEKKLDPPLNTLDILDISHSKKYPMKLWRIFFLHLYDQQCIFYNRQYTDKTLTLRKSMYICERASLETFRIFTF